MITSSLSAKFILSSRAEQIGERSESICAVEGPCASIAAFLSSRAKGNCRRSRQFPAVEGPCASIAAFLSSRAKGNCRRSRQFPAVEGPCVYAAITALCPALFFASITARAQTPHSTPARNDVYAELTKASKKAARRPNPLASDPEAVAAGAKLFAQHCAECHGEMAEGGKKAPSLLAPEVQQSTPGSLFWLLTNGVVRRGMPVWSKLPEPQRWQLVSYIKSLTPERTDPEKTSP